MTVPATRHRGGRRSAAIAHDTPRLVVVPNVEILEVGENWHLSTGDTTFTPDDLASAVAAMDDPAVRSPVLKLGHDDQRPGFNPARDGQPAFGKLINLRTENEGMTLVADVAGVPEWLAEIWPTAYPSRSIEGYWDLTTATGHDHPFVVTALALLGEVAPGIETLADLPLAFGITVAQADQDTPAYGMVAAETAPAPAESTSRRFSGQPAADPAAVPPPAPAPAVASTPHRPRPASASVSYEDVRRAYYDQLEPHQVWSWWIRELVIDPAELIVDDDEGHLWRVPYSTNGTTVTFGDPVEVRVEYVDVAAATARQRDGVHVFASRDESREGVTAMDLTALRQRLGAPDTMSDEEVLALAAQRLDELGAGGAPPPPTGDATAAPPNPPPATPPPPPPPPATAPAPTGEAVPPAGGLTAPAGGPGTDATDVVAPPPAADPPPAGAPALEPAMASAAPPGVLMVQAEAWDRVQREAAAGAALAARIHVEDRNRFIAGVVNAGRLTPGNSDLRTFLEQTWDRDPAAAAQVAGSLQVAFATSETGHSAAVELTTDRFDKSDVALFPELQSVRAGQNGSR